MNITDFTSPNEYPQGGYLAAIFERQASLMEKYHAIEERNGLLQTGDCPVNIHDAKGQARLKDFAWRITEEITEATEARDVLDHFEHYLEEMIDALHFLVEQQILAGITAGSYCPEGLKTDLLDYLMFEGNNYVTSLTPITEYHIIERVGLAMNCLKNKPWKQSQMMTDEEKFYGYMRESLLALLAVLVRAGLTAQDVYDLYFRKNEVNKFRQRSNY